MISKDFLNRDTWDIDTINQLVKEEKFKEDLHLEYKQGSWVQSSDFKRNLRKWVSAFQNSDGGLLIIGIPEDNDHYPMEPDGVNIANFPSESPEKWLEDILKSGIYPNLIPFPHIFPPIQVNENKIIIVIEVFRTQVLLHKALDFGQFYHRHNYSIEPMDEWEERAILYGRVPPPILRISPNLPYLQIPSENRSEVLTLNVKNLGWGLAKYLHLSIIKSDTIELRPGNLPGLRNELSLISSGKISKELMSKFKLIENKKYIMVSVTLLHNVLHPQNDFNFEYNINFQKQDKIDENVCGFFTAEGISPQYFVLSIAKEANEKGIRLTQFNIIK